MINILDAMADKHLFAGWFKRPETWAAWRTFLAALFALPMNGEQLALYRECTGRTEPPTAPAKEGWLICGRRAGKSFMLALIATYLACFFDYAKYMARGERGVVLVLASDRRQARVIFRYVRGLVTNVRLLARMVERENDDSIDLNNGISVEIATSNFRSVRGYTIVSAAVDELAFWPGDDSASPDTEVLDAIKPAMATIPNAMLLACSSPHSKKGALYDAFKQHYGKPGDVLIWRAPTRVMNCTVSQQIIDQAYERDAAWAAAEYGAEFRSDLADFIDREAVLACVDKGVRERPPGNHQYFSFTDPSGGASDSMTAAIGHMEGDVVVVDALREIPAPFDPETAVSEFCKLFRSYGIGRTHGDRYAAAWTAQAFEKRRVAYRHSELAKSALYLNLLPHLNSKTIRLLDNPGAVNQIASLERRTARGGRDTIDHPAQAHDDIANAIAGLAYVCKNQRQAPVAQTGRFELVTWQEPAARSSGGFSNATTWRR